MAFSENLKERVRRRAHLCCCLCKSVGVEVHHITPQVEGGIDVEDNAAPLCPSCHETYGANPTKRKLIREARDLWFEICERRYSSDQGLLQGLRELLETRVSAEDFERFQSNVLSRLETIAANSGLPLSQRGLVDPKRHRFLYSTQTWLAYAISERYYHGKHFVYCSPVFSPRRQEAPAPLSSSPRALYHRLASAVSRGDRHEPAIRSVMTGLSRTAASKLGADEITVDEQREITTIVELAQVTDFRPLLYVIQFSAVAHLAMEVPAAQRAHPLGEEYVLNDLGRDHFDVIEL